LFGHPQDELRWRESLRWLRCATIDDPHNDVAIQMASIPSLITLALVCVLLVMPCASVALWCSWFC
jgi:hypothetical protein